MTDSQIRLFAFGWLKDQVDLFGDVLPRKLLQDGFSLSGENYGLVGPQGIWKPMSMKLPISITSVLGGKYPDSIDEKGDIFNYKYRGTNPFHRENVGLRELMNQRMPLICFLRIAENKYVPLWPVFIIKDNPSELIFSVAIDNMSYFINKSVTDEAADSMDNNARREYITVMELKRVHQKEFRERVLSAYRNQCTLCRLRHAELLDAAHIIGDKEDSGEPVIQNGLSLCKIHHSAFDQNIIGITPDFKIKIRKDVLEEVDGPMLKYGIQSLDDNYLLLPRHKENWPDKWRLEKRFSEFLIAG